MSTTNPARIACAFRAALHFIARTQVESNARNRSEFICHALAEAVRQGRVEREVAKEARAIVEARIAPAFTINTWLTRQGCLQQMEAHDDSRFDEIQTYRIRWVNELAREFFDAAPSIYPAPPFKPSKRLMQLD